MTGILYWIWRKDWGRWGLLEELAYCFWEVGVREDWCSISRIGGRNNNLHCELGEKVYHYASGAVWRVCNLGKELGWVVGEILIRGGGILISLNCYVRITVRDSD